MISLDIPPLKPSNPRSLSSSHSVHAWSGSESTLDVVGMIALAFAKALRLHHTDE